MGRALLTWNETCLNRSIQTSMSLPFKSLKINTDFMRVRLQLHFHGSQMKLRNLWLVLKDQGPWSRFWRNMRKGHLLGILSQRSHLNANGKPKIAYGSKASAIRAAESMAKKRNVYFSNYKCLHCNGYHIGKNSENKS